LHFSAVLQPGAAFWSPARRFTIRRATPGLRPASHSISGCKHSVCGVQRATARFSAFSNGLHAHIIPAWPAPLSPSRFQSRLSTTSPLMTNTSPAKNRRWIWFFVWCCHGDPGDRRASSCQFEAAAQPEQSRAPPEWKEKGRRDTTRCPIASTGRLRARDQVPLGQFRFLVLECPSWVGRLLFMAWMRQESRLCRFIARRDSQL